MKNRLLFFASISMLMASCGSHDKHPPQPYGPIPTAAQLSWHEMEMYCLIHFGVDTYTDKEWGYGDEDPAIFNPPQFDALQIVRAAKAGGFKGIIVVAKHHDGLCLWPTQTTTHNITKTSWKDGKGDMIEEFKQACDKEGMKLGLYCSPWDRNNPNYGKPEYVNIYREQLKELYSRYGPLFISWHDGANGGDGYYGGAREERKIDRSTYYGWDSTWAITRKMQPSAVIFGDVGPDVRWVGNEQGFAGATSWATYTPKAPDEGKQPSNGYVKYWEAVEGHRDGKYWMPAECDVPLRPGWFYHPSQDEEVKSPKALMDLYYKSVGRGANLDLGIAPDWRGLLHENDVWALSTFGDVLNRTFANNLAKGAKLTASNIRYADSVRFGPLFLLDDDRYSYWATDDSVKAAELTLELSNKPAFDVIRLKENIKLGQRIDSFAIEAFEQGQWKLIATGTSIGANRLIRLPQPVQTDKIKLRIIAAKACVALSDLGLFKEVAVRMTVSSRSGAPNTAWVSGIHKEWTITGTKSEDGRNAVDDDDNTMATSTIGEIILDFKDTLYVNGFYYQPRQDGFNEGIVDKYKYAVSIDGKNWKEAASGEYGNIKSNPVVQYVGLSKGIRARYIKLTALHLIEGKNMTISELGFSFEPY